MKKNKTKKSRGGWVTPEIYFCPRRCVNRGRKWSPLSAEGKTRVPLNLQAGESSVHGCTHSHEAFDASAGAPFLMDSDQSEKTPSVVDGGSISASPTFLHKDQGVWCVPAHPGWTQTSSSRLSVGWIILCLCNKRLVWFGFACLIWKTSENQKCCIKSWCDYIWSFLSYMTPHTQSMCIYNLSLPPPVTHTWSRINLQTINSHSQSYNLPSNSRICFSPSRLHFFTSLFVLACSFSNFISFFSCRRSRLPPIPRSHLHSSRCRCVTDRCCIPFGFPLQLYSPGNWAQLLSQGAADFHRRFEEPTHSSAISITGSPHPAFSFLSSFPHVLLAPIKSLKTNTAEL